MSAGHLVHVVDLTSGGQFAVEIRAVPRGDAALDEAMTALQHPVTLAHHFVKFWIAVGAIAFAGTHRGTRPRRPPGRRRGRRRRLAGHEQATARHQQRQHQAENEH